MSIFDAIGSFFGGRAGQGLLQAGASLGGQLISSRANKDASERMGQGYQDYSAAIREGNAAAQRRYEEAKGFATPAMAALNRVVATPANALTPAQQIGLEDSHRRATATVASSGLRGAGRAGVGAIMDSDRRYLANAQDKNQGRSDSAMRTLSGTYNTAIGGQARADQDTGAATGRAALGTAGEDASGDLATSRGWGQTLGLLSNVIARGGKEGPTYDDSFSSSRRARARGDDDPNLYGPGYAKGGRMPKAGRRKPPPARRAPPALGGGRPVPITAHEGEYMLPAPVVSAMGGPDAIDPRVQAITGVRPNGARGGMAEGGRVRRSRRDAARDEAVSQSLLRRPWDRTAEEDPLGDDGVERPRGVYRDWEIMPDGTVVRSNPPRRDTKPSELPHNSGDTGVVRMPYDAGGEVKRKKPADEISDSWNDVYNKKRREERQEPAGRSRTDAFLSGRATPAHDIEWDRSKVLWRRGYADGGRVTRTKEDVEDLARRLAAANRIEPGERVNDTSRVKRLRAQMQENLSAEDMARVDRRFSERSVNTDPEYHDFNFNKYDRGGRINRRREIAAALHGAR